MKDLVVLVADDQQKIVVETLLEKRCPSLGIRQLRKQQDFEVIIHRDNDPGVYGGAAQSLRDFITKYNYGIVILDAEWSGSPGSSAIKETIQTALDRNGWENRSATIVIDPELEIWVWSSSPEVSNILGKTWEEIRQIAEQQNFWQPGAAKPHRPKELMEAVLRQAGKRRAKDIFIHLAETISLKRCEDPSFQELKQKLQEWFPLD